MEKKKVNDLLNSRAAKVGVATVAMVGAGAAGAAAAVLADANDASEVELVEEGLSMAGSVNDDMSFEDAFEAARAEVGPGGLFEWHGQVYNTYTETEWNTMSDEERQQFAERIGDEVEVSEQSHSSHATSHTASSQPEPQPEPEPEPYPEPEPAPAPDPEPQDVEIVVHGVEEVVREDGSVATVATVNIGGQEAALVDSDHDGIFDVGAVDLNNDHIIGNAEGEIFDVSEAGLSVTELAAVSQHESITFENTDDSGNDIASADYVPEDDGLSPEMPDYVNDADCFM